MKDKIYDIYDIEKISYFPLAIGYIGIISIFAISLISYFLYKKIKSYQRQKINNQLKEKLNILSKSEKILIYEFHKIIKKILLLKYNRKESANLTDKQLINFLHKNDPSKYNWKENGIILNNVFAPNQQRISNNDNIKELINAIKKWL